MRWVAVLVYVFLSCLPLALGQAEVHVVIKLPASIVLESTETKVDDEHSGVYSSLAVFTQGQWQLLVSADRAQPRMYAQLNDDKRLPLTEFARPTGIHAGGWQTLTISTYPNQLLQEKATIIYSVVHP